MHHSHTWCFTHVHYFVTITYCLRADRKHWKLLRLFINSKRSQEKICCCAKKLRSEVLHSCQRMQATPCKASRDLYPIQALARITGWIKGGCSNILLGTGSKAVTFNSYQLNMICLGKFWLLWMRFEIWYFFICLYLTFHCLNKIPDPLVLRVRHLLLCVYRWLLIYD